MANRIVKFERFKLNRKTVARIAVSREVADMTEDAAQKARAVAVSFSPRTSRAGRDHYADQFGVLRVIVTGVPKRNPATRAEPMTRAGAYLYNDSDYAEDVEFGWSVRDGDGGFVETHEGYHVFRNTLIALDAAHRAAGL